MVDDCVYLAVKSKAPDKAPAGGGSSFNQLLGIKGASQETVIPLYTHLFSFSFPSLVLGNLSFPCGGCFCYIFFHGTGDGLALHFY